ncbi:MAG: amidophosphoribosyltransferase [Thermoguttaceae bacterium]|nr:amidophosphoribosyltransferase [Thermoguttaceae bacterium]
MSELHEECGVVAAYHLPNRDPSPLCPAQGPEEISRLVPRMLLDLQNRGQLSAGVSTYNPRRKQLLKTYKDVGTVAEVFHQSRRERYSRLMDDLAGRAAIGHVRYATSGRDEKSYAHPFERPHIKKNKWFAFAFNGQLANYDHLKSELLDLDENAHFARDSDSEIFMHFLCAALKNSERDLLTVCKKTTEPLDGAYSLVFMNALGEMFVARDPRGFKPLCYAFDGSLFAAASESVALFNLGFAPDAIKDVPPGYAAFVSPERGVELKEFCPSPRPTHCFFEWIYFANVASVLDGKSVYLARKRLGEELAARETVPIDEDSIVVPVPDTSKAAADGMAYALKIPCLEGLMRNRYSGRTFIEGGESRRRKAETKYCPLPQVLEGKRVFLVEDSIVRSTTMRVLIERVRKVGRAKEIHVRVACPPIVAPCFYGIDMSTYSELFATSFMMKHYGLEGVTCCDDLTTRWRTTPEIEAEMAEDLGCDSLRYLPVDALPRAIGIPSLCLCEACTSHEYPTEWGCKLSDAARENFLNGVKGRTYD